MRGLLADSLVGVVAQQLIPKADGSGRVAAHEILLGSLALTSLIREGKTQQIGSFIQSGLAEGMQTMDSHLAALVRQGRITYDTALEKCHHVEDFNRLAGRG